MASSWNLFIIVLIYMVLSFVAVAFKYQTSFYFRLSKTLQLSLSALHAGMVLSNILLFIFLCLTNYNTAGIPLALRIFGSVLLGLGAFLIVAGGLRLKAALFRPSRSDYLVTCCYYRIVRHPMYLGGVIAALGLALASASLFGLFYSVLFALILYWASRLEERDLAARFGEQFAAYRCQVPLILPGRNSFAYLLSLVKTAG